MLDERFQIRYVDLTFMLEIERRGTLPRNKVSALRGGLGQMLLEQNVWFAEPFIRNMIFSLHLRIMETALGM